MKNDQRWKEDVRRNHPTERKPDEKSVACPTDDVHKGFVGRNTLPFCYIIRQLDKPSYIKSRKKFTFSRRYIVFERFHDLISNIVKPAHEIAS